MGLDSVEIVVKIEETFGINIPDKEAEQIITVGDLHNAVWRHLEGRYSDRCKSQSIFYTLRQSFYDTFNYPKKDFRLESSPENIFPKENRRQIYFDFARNNNLTLPELELTKPLQKFFLLIGSVLIIGALVASLILINFFNYSKWVLLIVAVAIVLTIIISAMLNPQRVLIETPSIREFTLATLKLNYAALSKQSDVNRKEMELVINHIIYDYSGVKLHEITPEKKICDDLGVD